VRVLCASLLRVGGSSRLAPDSSSHDATD